MRAVKRAAAQAAFAAVVTFVVVASGDAPPDQYVTFGAQAAQIQDNYTNLVWQRVVAQTPTDHFGAQDACVKNGQRLPTYRELLTIVDEDPHDEWDPEAGAGTPRYIDPNAFPGTPAGPFWTMSPAPGGGFKVVDFGTGETSGQTLTAFYRCVVDVP